MKRNALLYILLAVGFGLGIYYALQAGKQLETGRSLLPPAATSSAVGPSTVIAPSQSGNALEQALHSFRENLHEPLSLLLVQLILIVVLARIFGAIFVKMGQPSVIGEMAAGIILGPSVVGNLAPGMFQFIFPASSLGALRILSQVGVILFMFVVGMEVDLGHFRKKAHAALVVSQTGIVLPFFLGVLLSLVLFRNFATPDVGFLAFALFMGTAMSMTAFPVLARILEDCELTKTFLGSTALTCAAISDVSAWSMLAFVVAIVKAGSPASLVLNLIFAVAFCSALLLLVKPWLNRRFRSGLAMTVNPSRGVMVGVLVLLFSSALTTEVIGLHALFGAFLVGIIMPENSGFRTHLRDRLENFSAAFLLPLFFAFIGLRTQVGLLNDWPSWGFCLLIIAAATFGKLGGSMAAARWTGMNWHDSFSLGALMNTRGLVELIVLNIGFDLRILSPQIFAMMVIMALVTTAMTGPLLSLGNWLRARRSILAGAPAGS